MFLYFFNAKPTINNISKSVIVLVLFLFFTYVPNINLDSYDISTLKLKLLKEQCS